MSPDWQIGFFDADGEVYFDKIVLARDACFSNIVRNYWWNGKEKEEKKEGYYSLIKLVKILIIEEKHVNDLINYVEGRYEVGEHWQIHELNKNIKLRISYGLEKITIEILSKHFNNIWCWHITDDLKIVNNIMYSCERYLFRNNERVVPQKLVINAILEQICFQDVDNTIYIPEIVMEEKADLKNIIDNEHGYKIHYSLLPHVQTLVIRNNPKVLCDLADYVNGKYKINNNNNNWQLHKLNKNIKIVIERSGIAFSVVKQIVDYFADVLIDNSKPQEYLAKQQPYQKSFQKHFDRYDLETDQIKNFVPASQVLRLENEKFNIGGSSRKINELHVNQKIKEKQFICFHDTDKPVVINEIIIEDGGDLRCVLQNVYYNGTDSGFFSLLRIAKQLEIRSNHTRDNQVLVDFADYIEGKYALNANWKQEELNRDMRITINSGQYSLSLSVAQRLGNYFRNVFIDRIWTLLETENIIDQECRDGYIFIDSRKTSPQKLVINAKLMGRGTLIAFKQANGKVHIPEITIGEQGCFAAIVRNHWQNNRKGNEYKSRYYSLIEHVETLTIRNNLEALKNFVDYVVGKYEIGDSNQRLQQLSKDIKVVVECLKDTFFHVLRMPRYFDSITINGKQPSDYIQIIEQEESKNLDYKAFRTCFEVHDLCVYPRQYGVEAQENLELVDYAYNIRKSVDNINQLTVNQKLDINQFVCFHDIDEPVTVNEIIIHNVGDLRNVLQNAYYSNGQGGFFSLLGTANRLEISNNVQAVEDLLDYVDGKYVLHPKWGIQALDRNMLVKINVVISPNTARKLRDYFKSAFIGTIRAPLETENVIDQECEYQYIFSNCKDTNPQKLVVNTKLESSEDLIMFNDADGEVCIPEITIGEHGSFGAIVYNQWQNHSGFNYYNYYSLVSYVETLTIQNNPWAVCDLDNYLSGDYQIQDDSWEVQKLRKNIIIRINGVSGLDWQIDELKDYFGYIFVDNRKELGNQRRGAIANLKLNDDKIQQKNTANADKHNAIAQADTEIAETRRRIERARARLGRRRARFQEYLALIE